MTFPYAGYHNNLHGYYYLYVSPGGNDSSGPATYLGYERYKFDSSPPTAVILMGMGYPGPYSFFYPLSHEAGWNTLSLDAHVAFVTRQNLTQGYEELTQQGERDIWIIIVKLLDLQ